ncbi:MAG: hypothetical protein AAB599_01215 [Patescibacteria group bacterium]
MTWINRLYIFFIGIILSITTGFGLAAFYPAPRMPQYPVAKPYTGIPRSCYDTPASQQTEECQKLIEEDKERQREYQAKDSEYQDQLAKYRNVNASYTRAAIFVGIAVGTFYALLGLMMLRSSKLVSNGLMLGGVLTAVFTRLLVNFASLGANTTGTIGADRAGYIQFSVLLLLSIGVLLAGKGVLKDSPQK